jgi:hypothetical protein
MSEPAQVPNEPELEVEFQREWSLRHPTCRWAALSVEVTEGALLPRQTLLTVRCGAEDGSESLAFAIVLPEAQSRWTGLDHVLRALRAQPLAPPIPPTP